MRCTLSKEIDFPPTLGELQAALVFITEAYQRHQQGPEEPVVRLVQGVDQEGHLVSTARGIVEVAWTT